MQMKRKREEMGAARKRIRNENHRKERTTYLNLIVEREAQLCLGIEKPEWRSQTWE